MRCTTSSLHPCCLDTLPHWNEGKTAFFHSGESLCGNPHCLQQPKIILSDRWSVPSDPVQHFSFNSLGVDCQTFIQQLHVPVNNWHCNLISKAFHSGNDSNLITNNLPVTQHLKRTTLDLVLSYSHIGKYSFTFYTFSCVANIVLQKYFQCVNLHKIAHISEKILQINSISKGETSHLQQCYQGVVLQSGVSSLASNLWLTPTTTHFNQ